MKKVIVGLGEILWDIFTDTQVLGGAPANFAFHAGQLGAESYIVSAVGKDELGEAALKVLAHNKAQHLIEQLNYPTGKVTVELDDKGIPNYIIHENVAWDHIILTEKIKEVAQRTDAVCFGSLAQRHATSRKTIRLFLEQMPAGSMKMFDINLRQHFYTKEVIHDSLLMATCLKINEDELSVVAEMFGMEDKNETIICNQLKRLYKLDLLILTKGAEGSSIYADEEVSHLPTKRVIVADTVGAGDAFTAAFVVSYLNDGDLKKAHALAVEVAAYVCSQQGAMPPLPDAYKI